MAGAKMRHGLVRKWEGGRGEDVWKECGEGEGGGQSEEAEEAEELTGMDWELLDAVQEAQDGHLDGSDEVEEGKSSSMRGEDSEEYDADSDEEDELCKTRVTVSLWQINEQNVNDNDEHDNFCSPRENIDDDIKVMASVRICDDPLVALLCSTEPDKSGGGDYDEDGKLVTHSPQRSVAVDFIVLAEPLPADGGGDNHPDLNAASLSARQRRYLGVPPDAPPQSQTPQKHPHRPGRVGCPIANAESGIGSDNNMWVPLSIMVAALPACESPALPLERKQRGERGELVARRIRECERRAGRLSSEGSFEASVDAVEENLMLKARMGRESPQELVCMLQSVAYLCIAYAVESIARKDFVQAKALVDRATGLTRKRLLKKCKVTELVRVGLRVATFNTMAALHAASSRSAPGASFRSLQQALKAVRKHKSGLEVCEAATLNNMAAVLVRQGNVHDSVTVSGAAVDLLKTLCPEAQAAWDLEFASPSVGCSGRCARLTALWAILAIAHHNLALGLEMAGNLRGAEEAYKEAHHLADAYLGEEDAQITAVIQRCLGRVATFRSCRDAPTPSPGSPGEGFGRGGYLHWGNPPTELRASLAKENSGKDLLLPRLLRFETGKRGGGEAPAVGGLVVPDKVVQSSYSRAHKVKGRGEKSKGKREGERSERGISRGEEGSANGAHHIVLRGYGDAELDARFEEGHQGDDPGVAPLAVATSQPPTEPLPRGMAAPARPHTRGGARTQPWGECGQGGQQLGCVGRMQEDRQDRQTRLHAGRRSPTVVIDTPNLVVGRVVLGGKNFPAVAEKGDKKWGAGAGGLAIGGGGEAGGLDGLVDPWLLQPGGACGRGLANVASKVGGKGLRVALQAIQRRGIVHSPLGYLKGDAGMLREVPGVLAGVGLESGGGCKGKENAAVSNREPTAMMTPATGFGKVTPRQVGNYVPVVHHPRPPRDGQQRSRPGSSGQDVVIPLRLAGRLLVNRDPATQGEGERYVPRWTGGGPR